MNPEAVEKTIHEIFAEFEPVFTAHKGGAELVAIEPEAVVLRLLGHCGNCALAPLTFGLGIENLIKQRLPHIKQIKYTN
jgi:Fe-S cluster biogenesis protein NfuA